MCRDRQSKTDIHYQAQTDDSEWETQEEDEEGWTLEDVEVQLVEPEEKKEDDQQDEASPPEVAKDTLSFFEPEARVLLNLIKLSESGSRWKTSSPTRKAVSLVEIPRSERSEEKAACRRRARYERCSSMLEKLQSCLNRAEAKSSAAALESMKHLEGKNTLLLQ